MVTPTTPRCVTWQTSYLPNSGTASKPTPTTTKQAPGLHPRPPPLDNRHAWDVYVKVRQHLTHRGRILIFFGSSGDLDYLRHLIDQEGFQRQVLAQHRLDRDGWQVDYFTFRLTA